MMRAMAAVSVLLMIGFAHTAAVRAGLRGSVTSRGNPLWAWVVVAYCAVGVLANAATPSSWERIVWLPVVSVMLASSFFVARYAERDRSAEA
jgi:hypothetical protein